MEWKVDETDSGFCPVEEFCISDAKLMCTDTGFVKLQNLHEKSLRFAFFLFQVSLSSPQQI
jgi:hypothetical protein